jgi:hypothetical protein
LAAGDVIVRFHEVIVDDLDGDSTRPPRRVNVALQQASFRDAPLGAGPESITPVVMFCSDGLVLEHKHRGYGFSDAQLRIIARASRAPE